MIERTLRFKSAPWLAIAAPAGLAAILIGVLACMLLALSVREADDLVIQRDQKLAASILKQAVERIGHDQESVTAWDEAVTHLHGPLDPDWIDDNIGTWMNMYFGHERVVVLDPQDRPVYASIGAKRAEPDAFDTIAPLARPMIADLRRTLLSGSWQSTDPAVRSPGNKDLVVVDGHPAMLSVKPVVPSTARVTQAPADAFMHLTVHYLDGGFLDELRQRYLFEDARFSWQNDPRHGELAFALRNKQGQAIGYLLWTVHLPGQLLAKRMVPVLAGTLGAILVVVAVLVICLKRGARALEVSEARARHLAFHDSLTALPNRACFNEKLAAAFGEPQGASLLLLDLDRFKQVNDTLGHPAGDELLQHVAKRLIALSPQGATVYRLGGDEFALLQLDEPSCDVVKLCAAIGESLRRPFSIAGADVAIGVSIGVASTRTVASLEELIRRADQALYACKKQCRDDPPKKGLSRCTDAIPLAA